MSGTAYFTVYHLAARDMRLLRGMLAMFGDAFHEQRTYTDKQPGEDYLRGLLAGEKFIALAALRGETVIGGLAAYVLEKFEQEKLNRMDSPPDQSSAATSISRSTEAPYVDRPLDRDCHAGSRRCSLAQSTADQRDAGRFRCPNRRALPLIVRQSANTRSAPVFSTA
jgi:hypothetical protein